MNGVITMALGLLTKKNESNMMYLHGTIKPFYGALYGGIAYVCEVKTPGFQVSKISFRSRMESISEALKLIGLPL